MKNLKTSLSVLLITGSLGANGAAFGDDGVLVKEPASRESNYCYLKFPAIHEDTLASRRPVLKDPQSGDIVDFYGPCDENALGPNQIVSQKLQQENRWQSETGE